MLIKQDNGEIIEFIKELDEKIIFDEKDIISRIEKQVLSLREAILPVLSEKLTEQHQARFQGEKNKEKKRE